MYHGEDYDVAGFCVGVVEKSEIIDGSKVTDGDVLVALASSGPHSNGYSLVRKIIEVSGVDPQTTDLDGKPLADHLLAPTRIYVKSVLDLIASVDVHAIAHLTGGGFWENIPRVLPDNAQAIIDESSWQWPSVFNWLQTAGNVSQHEMYRTFNCGVGMIIALPAAEADKAIALLNDKGENAWKIRVYQSLRFRTACGHCMKNIVVLISGSGSNLRAIIDACGRKQINGTCVRYSVTRLMRSALSARAWPASRPMRWRKVSLPTGKRSIVS